MKKYIYKILLAIVFQLFITNSDAQKVSLGVGNVLYICPDSTISAIGRNQGDYYKLMYFNYQLGDGTNINRYYPVKVKGLHNVVSVNAISSTALLADGTVWQWVNDSVYDLHQIPIDSVISISSGISEMLNVYTLAIRKDGSLWAWGNKKATDNWSWGYKSIPVKLNIPKVQKVSAGQKVAIALCVDGSVWTWGDIQVDGNGNNSSDGNFTIPYPSKVNTITDVIDVEAGSINVFAIKKDGTVWEWGLGSTQHCICNNSFPTQLKISNVKSIFSGWSDPLYLIKDDGTLWNMTDSAVPDRSVVYPRYITSPKKLDTPINLNKIYPTLSDAYAYDIAGNLYRWEKIEMDN